MDMSFGGTLVSPLVCLEGMGWVLTGKLLPAHVSARLAGCAPCGLGTPTRPKFCSNAPLTHSVTRENP